MLYTIKYIEKIDPHLIKNEICPSEDRIKLLNSENNFFIKLEKSILKEGIRNPIIIEATKEKISSVYGGSRLMIAQKYNIPISCIVADFDNIFPNSLILKSIDDILKYFKDKPKKIFLKPHGIRASGCADVHLNEEFNV